MKQTDEQTYKEGDLVILSNGAVAKVVDVPTHGLYLGNLLAQVVLPDGKLSKMIHAVYPNEVKPHTDEKPQQRTSALCACGHSVESHDCETGKCYHGDCACTTFNHVGREQLLASLKNVVAYMDYHHKDDARMMNFLSESRALIAKAQ